MSEEISKVITFRPKTSASCHAASPLEGFAPYLFALYASSEFVGSRMGIKAKVVREMVAADLGIERFDGIEQADFDRAAQFIMALTANHSSMR